MPLKTKFNFHILELFWRQFSEQNNSDPDESGVRSVQHSVEKYRNKYNI